MGLLIALYFSFMNVSQNPDVKSCTVDFATFFLGSAECRAVNPIIVRGNFLYDSVTWQASSGCECPRLVSLKTHETLAARDVLQRICDRHESHDMSGLTDSCTFLPI